MCGRYALKATAAELIEHFRLLSCPEWNPRFNIAPQSSIPVIRFKPDAGRVGQLVRWGLIPSWAKDPSIGSVPTYVQKAWRKEFAGGHGKKLIAKSIS